VTLSNVAARLKGEWTFRPLEGKPSFRLRFDRWVKDQRLLGLSRLVLNNTVQDPSFQSERLAYAFAREALVPAPRAASALVYVNGELYGVYTAVEAIDKRFLRRWFVSHQGNLYEEGGQDFVRGAERSFDLETNEVLDDRSDLVALIEALDRATPRTFDEEVGRVLDVKQFVRYAALEALVGQVDGYAFRAGSPNNFRLYRDPGTGLFNFIAAGMDRAMRPPHSPVLVHPWLPRQPPYVDPTDAQGLLLKKCLAAPGCRAAYRAALMDLGSLFDAMRLGDEAQRMHQQLRPAVLADRRKELGNDYYDYAYGTLRDWIAGRTEALARKLP
jgi:spore coat protein CotH